MTSVSSNKRGITLIVLLITIIVTLIILSASTIKILDAADNSTIAAFAEELRSLEDSAREYYLQNNVLPVTDESSPLKLNDVLNMSSEDIQDTFRKALSEELEINSDNSDTTSFYKLDLAKLSVSTTTRGAMGKGNPKDIYVIAYPSFRIYYIDGVEAKRTIYFSLSRKIQAVNNVKVDISNFTNEDVNTTNASGLNVKKVEDGITNKMGIIISTKIDDANSEKLYLKVPNVEQRQIPGTFAGFNSIRIDNLKDNEKAAINSLLPEEKYVDIIKKKDNLEIAKVRVDISDYDSTCPVISGTPIIKKNSTVNLLYFDVSDLPTVNGNIVQTATTSGIKEVRYEYLKKYNEQNFTEKNYYTNTSDFTDSYMKSEAKKADISSSGTVKIELEKNVTKIKICIVDNAQNYTVYEQTTAGGINIGYSINSFNNNYFNLDLKIYTDEAIQSGQIQISSDGVNFIEPRDFSNIPALSTQTINVVYDNVITLENFAYVKVIMNKASNEQEEQIIKIDLNM